MDDADDQHAVRLLVVENDVLPMLVPSPTAPNVIGLAAKAGITGKKLETSDDLIPVAFRFRHAEFSKP